ncbi:MAG: hypothetical protein PGN34_15370 [Methylobacterium frigidaeris]
MSSEIRIQARAAQSKALRAPERSRFPHRESDCAAIATIPQGSPSDQSETV